MASVPIMFVTADKMWNYEQAEKQKKAFLEFKERKEKALKKGEKFIVKEPKFKNKATPTPSIDGFITDL